MQYDNLNGISIETIEKYERNGVFFSSLNNLDFNCVSSNENLLNFLKSNLNDEIYVDYKMLNKLDDKFPFYYYFPIKFDQDEDLKCNILKIIKENFPKLSTKLLGDYPNHILIIFKNNLELNSIFQEEDCPKDLFQIFSNLIISKDKRIQSLENSHYNENISFGNWHEEKNLSFNDELITEVNLTNKKRNSPDFSSTENEFISKKTDNKKIYLPKINNIKIKESYSDSVIIETNLVNRNIIKEKNSYSIFSFDRLTVEFKLSYIVFIFDSNSKKYEFKNEFFIDESLSKGSLNNELNEKNKKFFEMIINNLEENKLYSIKIFIKFGEYISIPSDNFNIRTSFRKINEKNINRNINNFYWSKFKELNENFDLKAFNNNLFSEFDFTVEEFLHLKKSIQIKYFNISNDNIYFLTSNSEIICIGKVNENLIASMNGKINATDKNNDVFADDEYDGNFITTKPLYLFSNQIERHFLKIPVIKITSGLDFCLALDSSGAVYSWGSNGNGQLGINLAYDDVISFQMKKINFSLINTHEEIFIYDIETTKFSCIALGIKNGKQRFYRWGLGCGTEKIDSQIEKANIILKCGLFVDDNEIDNLILYRSTIPILYDIITNFGKIIKIKGLHNIFSILSKQNNKSSEFNICSFLGFYRSPGFPMEFQNKQNMKFSYKKEEYILYTNEFFIKNNLSVIDTAIGNDFIIFLVNNLNSDKNELYSFGLNKNGECGLIDKQFYSDIVRVTEKALNNPIKLKAGKDSTFVLVKNIEKENDKFEKKKLFRIGYNKAIFDRNVLIPEIKSSADIINEINIPEIIIENDILKIDFFLDKLLILYK